MENNNQAANTANAAPAEGNNAGGEASKTEKVVFTPEQQAHIDKMLDAQHAKVMAKADKKLEAIAEAERLKTMSAEERVNAELQKAKEKIAEYEKQQLVSQFKVELTEKGLPAGFAEHIAVTDAEKAKAAVDFLSKHQAAILKEKDDKIAKLEEDLRNATLRGTAPKQVGNNTAPQETGKMSYSQIMQLAEKDPSIITKYTGGN